MKAAIFEEAHKPLTIEEVDIRKPQAGEVLVRTAASGVCHSDLHFVDGAWAMPMACVLGHEASGVVEQVGEDVSYVVPGDKVIMSFRPFCGVCYFCQRGEPHLCNDESLAAAAAGRLTWKGQPVMQFANVGSFAETMLTVENAVVKIPEEMPMEEAALVGCGVMTGVGAALYTAGVAGGADVAVIGCGGIGLNVIQGCRLAGAARIIAIDVMDSKLEMARNFGATDTINSTECDDVVSAVQDLTSGLGCEYSFEAVGLPELVTLAWDLIRPGGTATVVGMMPMGSEVKVSGPDFLSEKKLIGSMYGSTRFREHMPKLVDLFLQGRLDLTALVSEKLRLDQVNDAFALMKSGKVARSVLQFDV